MDTKTLNIGRVRLVWFPKGTANFGFHRTTYRRGTMFLDIGRFRIWRDGRP